MAKISPVSAFFLNIILVNGAAFANSADNNMGSNSEKYLSGSSAHVSKEDWLKAVIPLIPDRVCKELEQDENLKKRVAEINMNYQKCINVIPDSISKCQKQLYDKIPENIDMNEAAALGKSLGDCIGKDFFNTYFTQKQK